MNVKLRPLNFKFSNPLVKSAQISRGFFPQSKAIVGVRSFPLHSWRCDAKSSEVDENQDMESGRCDVKIGEYGDNLGMESSILYEQTLQCNLEKAIKEEDYAYAAKLRDRLRFLREDSKASVLAASYRFYDAFKMRDHVAMHDIWAKRKNVIVVHLGTDPISDYDSVMKSWKYLFRAFHELPFQVDLLNVQVQVMGDVGYVTCTKIVKSEGGGRYGMHADTSIFQRIDARWYMCLYHSSAIHE